MKKPMADFVPAMIDPPMAPFGFKNPELLAEWVEFRAEMNELEAALSAERPELDWSQVMRPHKEEADAAIKALRRGGSR